MSMDESRKKNTFKRKNKMRKKNDFRMQKTKKLQKNETEYMNKSHQEKRINIMKVNRKKKEKFKRK